MATRQKAVVMQNITQQQAEEAFAEYSKNNSQVKSITGKMEQEITKVREKYSDDLERCNKAKDSSFAILQTYALENETLFDKKKSMEMVHGKLGFRTGTPTLKNLKGYTWESVKNLVKEFLGGDYIRTKEEVNKELLIQERENTEVAQHFTKCGIEVRQEETFFVEPKEEEA